MFKIDLILLIAKQILLDGTFKARSTSDVLLL